MTTDAVLAKPYSVNLWGSNPDITDNDDCWTGDDFATREEAIRVYREVVMFPDHSQLAKVCGRGGWEFVARLSGCHPGAQMTSECVLDTETRRVLDEVTRHSNTRTGKVALAIEAGLVAIGDGSALAERHLRSLHEWVSMVSECGGVGDRWRRWRRAVMDLILAYEDRRRGC
jgi:hypothetical protein